MAGRSIRVTRLWTFAGLASLVWMVAFSCSTGAAHGQSAYDESRVEELEGDVVRYEGVWEGSLQVQGTSIDIVVKFLVDPVSPPDSHSGHAAEMDIPAQMAYRLPLSAVSVSGRGAGAAVHFELATGGPPLIADGRLIDDGSIAGTFTQGPSSGEFALSRTADLVAADAPVGGNGRNSSQTGGPAKGTGFAESEVSIVREGATIHGTLVEPESEQAMPLLVLVAGSGPTDRDGNSALLPGRNDGHRMLAEALAERGIATLRYDKRGIGQSAYDGFREEDLTFDAYVNDLLQWISWADSLDAVSEVFVAGHSEGGLVVLAALGSRPAEAGLTGIDERAVQAARTTVSGAICMAAPGRPLDEVMMEQLERDLPGDSPLLLSAREIFRAIRDGNQLPDVPQELQPLFRESVQPYLRSVIRFRPADLARNLVLPLLVVAGAEDLQVPVSDARALAAAQPDARLIVISGMNHVLKTVSAGDRDENLRAYGDPSFALPDELVDAVSGFVSGQ